MWFLSPVLLALAAGPAFAEGCPPGTYKIGEKRDGLDIEVQCRKYPPRPPVSSVPERADYHTAAVPLLREAREAPATFSFKVPRTDIPKVEFTPTSARIYRMLRDASAVPVPQHDVAPASLIVDLAETTGKVMRQAPSEAVGMLSTGFKALAIVEMKDNVSKDQKAEAAGAGALLVVGVVNPPLGAGAAIGGYLGKNALLGWYTFQAMSMTGMKEEQASRAAVNEYNRSCEEDSTPMKFMCGMMGRALP